MNIIFFLFTERHVAYVPGIRRWRDWSKLARTVEVFFQTPSDPGTADRPDSRRIDGWIGAPGVMVMMEAEHMCMTMRGIKSRAAGLSRW